jgi:hypothetical protein
MATKTVYVRVPQSKLQLVNHLKRNVVAQIAGKQAGPIQRQFSGMVAHEFFRSMHRNYEVLALGQTNEFGERWDPVKPETIKRRKKNRGIITKRLRKRWWQVYDTMAARFIGKGELTNEQARVKARRSAWQTIRGEAVINVDTRRLINSVRPTQVTKDGYKKKRDQVADLRPGKWEMGTKVKYGKYVQAKRPFISSKANIWIFRGVTKAITRINEFMTP